MKWFTWDTLTNAAYIAVAILVAHADGPTGWVFIATMAFLTIGSAMYHAGVPQANHLDVMGIYAVGLWLFVGSIVGSPLAPMLAVLFGGGTVAAAYWLRMKQLDVRMEVKVGALFGVLYATAFLFHGANQPLTASVSMMVVALLVRRYNHGLWHLLSAAGLGLLWIGVS